MNLTDKCKTCIHNKVCYIKKDAESYINKKIEDNFVDKLVERSIKYSVENCVHYCLRKG